LVSIVRATCAVVVCRKLWSAVTVIVSSRLPSSSSASTAIWLAAVRRIPVLANFLKPGISIVTV
jgi:hypothetical protein